LAAAAALLDARDRPAHEPDTDGETDVAPEEAVVPETPDLDPAALKGVVGDLVRLIEPHTEAHPAGILFSCFAMVGALIGRGPHQVLDGARHGANLFVLLTGPTSSGRKGTAAAWARRIVRTVDEQFDRTNFAGGLSTGEGLIYRVRDATQASEHEKRSDPGISDKRLVVTAEEMGAAFRKAQGRENNLSHTLRIAWDGVTLRTLTRREAMTATDPHISLVGQITAEELRQSVTDGDAAGGTLNRFLFCAVERVRSLPHGADPDTEEFDRLTSVLRSRVFDARSVGRMELDPEAHDWWGEHYELLVNGNPGRLGQVTRRAAPYVRRLAMLYALLRGRRSIGIDDLSAALAAWRYAEDSARYIFGGFELSQLEHRILACLDGAGPAGLSRTAVRHGAVRSNNTPGSKITAALVRLREAGMVRMRKQSTGGRQAELWFLTQHELSANGKNGRVGKEGRNRSNGSEASHK